MRCPQPGVNLAMPFSSNSSKENLPLSAQPVIFPRKARSLLSDPETWRGPEDRHPSVRFAASGVLPSFSRCPSRVDLIGVLPVVCHFTTTINENQVLPVSSLSCGNF
jgi:hypothetical protein